MAYTNHGHHIPGTKTDNLDSIDRARCGGVNLCPQCIVEANRYRLSREPAIGPADFIAQAKGIVKDHIDAKFENPGTYEVYVVWFTKVLQNWKALVASTLPYEMYYEITYDGEKRCTYLDAYKKTEHVIIED